MCRHLILKRLMLAMVVLVWIPTVSAQTTPVQSPSGERFEYTNDFESGSDDWKFVDDGWKLATHGKNHALSLHQKKSNFTPPFRSPLHIALLKDKPVTSFELQVNILSTHEDYNHRDVCLFFGYQSPSQYYYVHLGKKTDPHANQIFIVNNAARTKISLTTTEGTPWDEKWHTVKLVRDSKSGDIRVFFDDPEKPIMTAKDNTFRWGLIGLGSFDDTADFDNVKLTANAHVTVHGSDKPK